MSLEEYLKGKGGSVRREGNQEWIDLDDYSFYIEGDTLYIPIPLPTGKEKLDDLVGMGIKYARASRISQGIGSPLSYEIKGEEVIVYRKFSSREELEQKLIKALESIEGLRYYI
ncbi:hypothetical protein [Sulfuracidifex metallicus]|uniref:Uncharacterized protein n=1 Tax=Sulfuracidifex metallicus DSM 6482 = JCM 9184 TaxID=523847 RepID=A0A6A9QQ59_SULME|nr:hypothetical protein [Sulfuracidifex metallicus DSM 6482 = JCM 9184]